MAQPATERSYDKSVLSPLLGSLTAGERKDFHNVVTAFLMLANKRMVKLPTREELVEIIATSKALSPALEPAGWLQVVLKNWQASPLLLPAGYAPQQLTSNLGAQMEANKSQSEIRDCANYVMGEYNDGRCPPVVGEIVSDRAKAEQFNAAYKEARSTSVTAVMGLGGSLAGKFLALAYDNEDTTTSHVFQAMRLKGFVLDEQAGAQVDAFARYAKRELPEGIMLEAERVARFLPTVEMGIPISLTVLHAQPHRYDLEALGPQDLGV